MNTQDSLNQLAIAVDRYIREVQQDLVHISPVLVNIAGEVFAGCRYRTRHHYEAGMMAVTHGGKTTKDVYDLHKFYLVGDLPKVYQKAKREKLTGSKRICFQIESEKADDWYVSCYFQESEISGEIQQYHPFGKTFMFGLWNAPDGSKIDDGLDSYKRVNISVLEVPNDDR